MWTIAVKVKVVADLNIKLANFVSRIYATFAMTLIVGNTKRQ